MLSRARCAGSSDDGRAGSGSWTRWTWLLWVLWGHDGSGQWTDAARAVVRDGWPLWRHLDQRNGELVMGFLQFEIFRWTFGDILIKEMGFDRICWNKFMVFVWILLGFFSEFLMGA